MNYLLDTNVCIRYLNDPESLIAKRLQQHNPSDISVCAVVKAELYYGAAKSQNPQYTQEVINTFLSPLFSYPFDDRAAEFYGKIRAYLSGKGILIGPNDLLIAAIALVHDITLVTHNTREFTRVEGLHIEDWEID